jgi:uncharacterized membrane protein YfcA
MDYLLLFSIFIIAILYSSVGHGGASGYLAVMALFGIDVIFMKASALTLNLFVAGMAFILYLRAGYFRWKTVMPFLITSIPMAYLGARIPIDPKTYKIILGIVLIAAIARMLLQLNRNDKMKDPPILPALLLGAVLGFVSGMIGIGGGIILTPLLILLKWANVKEAAAASAIFIFLNSASGLTGLYLSGFNTYPDIVVWIVVAFIGGVLGGYMGSYRLSLRGLTYFLMMVLLVASIKLFVF